MKIKILSDSTCDLSQDLTLTTVPSLLGQRRMGEGIIWK